MILRAFIYRFVFLPADAFYGDKLHGLAYRAAENIGGEGTKWKMSRIGQTIRILIGVWYIGGEYTVEVVNRIMTNNGWSRQVSSDEDDRVQQWKNRAWTIWNRLETAMMVLSFVNTLSFLINGRHRSLMERCLNVTIVPRRRLTRHSADVEFLNREQLWVAFADCTVLLLPLVDVDLVQKTIRRMLPLRQKSNNQLIRNTIPADACAICVTSQKAPAIGMKDISTRFPVCMPTAAKCGHFFCYYCVKSGEQMESQCPLCNKQM